MRKCWTVPSKNLICQFAHTTVLNVQVLIPYLNLTEKTEPEMMKVRNLGRKSLEEVKVKLADLGLGLKNDK